MKIKLMDLTYILFSSNPFTKFPIVPSDGIMR